MWVVGGDVAGDFGEVGLGCHFRVRIGLIWVDLGWIGEMVLWLVLEAGVFSCLVKLEMIVVVMIVIGEHLEVLLYISDCSPYFVRERRIGTCFNAIIQQIAACSDHDGGVKVLAISSEPSQDPSRGQCEGLKLASRDGDS